MKEPILKLFYNDKKQFKLINYDINLGYIKFIEEKRDKGYTQIILHSRLIIAICESFLENHHLIRDIEIDEGSYIDITDLKLKDIKDLNQLSAIREELLFKDDHFIEIKSVTTYNKEKNILYKIRSNGILIGYLGDKEEIINDFILNLRCIYGN